MIVTLIRVTRGEEVHGSEDGKKTACGVLTTKPENVAKFIRGESFEFEVALDKLTCEKCITRLAKKNIREDRKEMSKLLKEEKKRGGDDSAGLVQLSNVQQRPTKVAAPPSSLSDRMGGSVPAWQKNEYESASAPVSHEPPSEPFREELDVLAQFAVPAPRSVPTPPPVPVRPVETVPVPSATKGLPPNLKIDKSVSQFMVAPQESKFYDDPVPEQPNKPKANFSDLSQFAIKAPPKDSIFDAVPKANSGPVPSGMDATLAQFAMPPQNQPSPRAVEVSSDEESALAEFAAISESFFASAPVPQPAVPLHTSPVPQSAQPITQAVPVFDDVTDILSQFELPQAQSTQTAAMEIEDISPVTDSIDDVFAQSESQIYEPSFGFSNDSAASEYTFDEIPSIPVETPFESGEKDMLTQFSAPPVPPIAPVSPVVQKAPVQPVVPSVPTFFAQTGPATPIANDIDSALAQASAPVIHPAPIPYMQNPYVQTPIQAPPQIMGYDPNGQPIYGYVQQQIVGYDAEGKPMFAPVQIPVPVAPIAPVAPIPFAGMTPPPYGIPVPAANVYPGMAPSFGGEPVQALPRSAFGQSQSPYGGETKVVMRPEAINNAIAKSAKKANKTLFDMQELEIPVIDSIEDALSQMADGDVNYSVTKNDAKPAPPKPNLDRPIGKTGYGAPPTRGGSTGYGAPPSRNESRPDPYAHLDEKARKKQEKIDAKFKKELSKRGF